MKKLFSDEKIEKYHYLIVGLIFALACAVRVIGIDWGLPDSNLHPDEGIIFGQAYQCALDRSFEVREYYRPNHVTIKLVTLLYTALQDVFFSSRGLDDFATNFAFHTTAFLTASRLLIALFGIGVVVFAYLIGRIFGKKQGLMAALLFAIFPAFIEHSHYITPDIPLLFFLMGVLWAGLKYHKKQSITWIFWMSFFTALATCEKYPGIYGSIIIAAAIIISRYKKPIYILRDGALAVLFLVIGVMAISPVLIIDHKTVLEVLKGQNHSHHLGADGLNFPQTLWYYLKTTGVHIGLLLSLFSIYGVVKSIKKDAKRTLILLSFFMYWIPISALKVHWERYTLPLYAFGLIMASMGICYFSEGFVEKLEKKKMFLTIKNGLVALSVISLFMGSVAMDARFLSPDSRVYTVDKLAELGVGRDNSVYDCSTPLDYGGYYGAFANFVDGNAEEYKYGPMPQFIVTSSSQRDLYLISDQEYYGGVANFYRQVDDIYRLIYIYTPENPKSCFIEIYNIGYAIKNVIRYARGAANGFEIRVYQTY